VANPLHEIQNTHDFVQGEVIMKKTLILITLVAITMLVAAASFAVAPANTLYLQEGDSIKDGYLGINAAGHGPTGTVSDNYTNWKWQTGAGSYAGVYSWDGAAWLDISSSGDETIQVEADIELFWSESLANNEIYFHIGNPSTLSSDDKMAHVTGTYAGNHPEYVGISFDGTSKVAGDFDLATGKVAGGMVGTIDNHGTDISSQNFDTSFLLALNGGAYIPPTSFGDGAHGTEPACLWWSPVATGMITQLAGTMVWRVQIYPAADQADGNYHLDPVLVHAPEL